VDATDDARVREIVETARREDQKAKQRTREAVKRARAFLPELVQAFRTIDPDLRLIVLFGSPAEGTVRGERFDLDIATRSRRYLQLVAWGLDQDQKIDVIDLDAAQPHIAERIRSRGEVLYAAEEGL
jgi:hypothetical protein